jgi:hypothetical protein
MFLFALGLLMPLASSAQAYVEGQVLDAESLEPLPFVNVTYNGRKAGTTGDLDGFFSIETPSSIQSLEFSYVGYKKKSLPINGSSKKALRILLERDDLTLMEALVLPGENPAHRIIRKASDARQSNDPLELSTFEYTSYNKLIFTIDADSVSAIDSTGAIDSSNFELKKFFNRNHLFLMESATERKYIKGSRDHEEVLASRTSGFQNPTFTLIGTQLQSFSFYKDELEVLFTRYINPLRKNSMREYFFLLQDTIFSESDQDTVYVIGFRPKNAEREDLLHGSLYIGTQDYALRNVLASYNDTTDEVPVSIGIQQKYARFGDHWFPVQLMTDITFGGIQVNDVVPKGYGRTYIRDIKVEIPLEKKKIPRLELSLDADAFKKDESYWEGLRQMPLDSQEQQTYVVIDSIGEEFDLEKRVGFLTRLIDGKLRFGAIDFDLDRILMWNLPYEGLRLGFGAHTNERLSKHVSFGGHFGYGTKDFDWKYGLDLVYRPEVAGPWTFKLIYDRDLQETGGRQFILSRSSNFLSGNNIRRFNLERFDMTERLDLQVHVDLLPNLNLALSYALESREGKWPKFQNDQVSTPAFWEGSLYGLGLAWAPNDRYMAGPQGRKRLETTYPIIEVDYRYGLTENSTTPSEEPYFHRLDFRFIHLWKNLRYGDIRVEAIIGGTLGSDAPVSYVFSPYSNLRNQQNKETPPFGIGAPRSFEMLFKNEFTSDLQTEFMFNYFFPRRVLKIKNWSPQLVLQQAFLWGQLQRPELYQGVYASVQAPELGYFESGIELKNIFNSLGIGFYYRYGAYSRADFEQNLGIKLTTTGLF